MDGQSWDDLIVHLYFDFIFIPQQVLPAVDPGGY